MALPPFNCRNTLERLRESYDEQQRKEQDATPIRIVRVEYTVRTPGEDGKTVSVNNERFLPDLASIDPKHIQQVLEEEVRASEQLGNNTPGSSLVATNIRKLMPTGDDDQMYSRRDLYRPWTTYPKKTGLTETFSRISRRPRIATTTPSPLLNGLSGASRNISFPRDLQ